MLLLFCLSQLSSGYRTRGSLLNSFLVCRSCLTTKAADTNLAVARPCEIVSIRPNDMKNNQDLISSNNHPSLFFGGLSVPSQFASMRMHICRNLSLPELAGASPLRPQLLAKTSWIIMLRLCSLPGPLVFIKKLHLHIGAEIGMVNSTPTARQLWQPWQPFSRIYHQSKRRRCVAPAGGRASKFQLNRWGRSKKELLIVIIL